MGAEQGDRRVGEEGDRRVGAEQGDRRVGEEGDRRVDADARATALGGCHRPYVTMVWWERTASGVATPSDEKNVHI